MKLSLAVLILFCSIASTLSLSMLQTKFRDYYKHRGVQNYHQSRPKVSHSNNQSPWNNQPYYNKLHTQQQQNQQRFPQKSWVKKSQYNNLPREQKNSKKCGVFKPIIRNKVANGKSTQHFEWPWYVQVIVKTDVEAYCGGTLISNEYILTAAHCFDDIPKEQLARATTVLLRGIRLFNHRQNDFEKIEAQAVAVILHPEYVPTMGNDEAERLGIEPGPRNDIALIKINIERPEVRDKLMPACLPSNYYKLPIGTNCKIMGHGFTNPQSEDTFTMPKMLQMADVMISDNAMCRAEVDSEAIRTKITEDTLCIRGPIHPCVGDSGGPLICKGSEPNDIRGAGMNEYDYEYDDGRDEEWYLAGVTSFAVSTDMNDKCGLFKSAIFGKVSHHRDWIGRVCGV